MADVPAPRRRLKPLPNVLIFAGFALAILQLIQLFAAPDSPLRGGGPALRYNDQRDAALEQLSGDFARTARGRPIALHVSIPAKALTGPGPRDNAAANELAAIYYYTATRFYPNRLYVGEDDRVINFGRDLPGPAASPRWLIDHGVNATIDIGVNASGNLTFPVIPVLPGPTTQP